MDELTLSEWQQLLDFNLTGTFLFINAVVPVMKRQRSRQDRQHLVDRRARPEPGRAARLRDGQGRNHRVHQKLSFELGPFGVTVNAIAPSLTLSPRLQPRWDGCRPRRGKRERRVPLRRVAVPEDQARVICFLASSDADFVTGVTIDVTGGS